MNSGEYLQQWRHFAFCKKCDREIDRLTIHEDFSQPFSEVTFEIECHGESTSFKISGYDIMTKNVTPVKTYFFGKSPQTLAIREND